MDVPEETMRKAEYDFGVLRTRATLTLLVDVPTAMALLGCIQLAVRHPNNTGPMADLARRVGRQVGEWLSVSEACKAYVDAGWGEAGPANQG